MYFCVWFVLFLCSFITCNTKAFVDTINGIKASTYTISGIKDLFCPTSGIRAFVNPKNVTRVMVKYV